VLARYRQSLRAQRANGAAGSSELSDSVIHNSSTRLFVDHRELINGQEDAQGEHNPTDNGNEPTTMEDPALRVDQANEDSTNND
jgi:hypothetical protein